ncbi:hypothetical protein ACHZ98_33895 [Streptomyces sp. MAR4 CNY-716]
MDRFTGMNKTLGFPAVPTPDLGDDDDRPSDATRLLCAAAHLRPDWDKQIRSKLRQGWREIVRQIAPRWLKELLQARDEKAKLSQAATVADGTKRDPQKFVPLGLDYARWVHRRVLAKELRPVPSHGFDLAEVALSCAQAIRLGRQRRVLMFMAWIVAGLCWWGIGVDWALLTLLVGIWAVCLSDRLVSQRLLREVMAPEADGGRSPQRLSARYDGTVQRMHGLEGQPVIPYEQQIRPGQVRYHFLGAGKSWPERNIGIDVMAPPQKDGEGQNSRNAVSPAELRLLPSANHLLADGKPGAGVDPFTPDDLLRHVESELTRAVSPDRDFHPANRQDVFSMATINSDRWANITDDEWAGLVSLAHDGTKAMRAFSAPKIARRALCARMVSWDGEILAFVFVTFSYENHFLRVIVRPQVVNPIHPALYAAWPQSKRTGWRFIGRSMLLALADTGVTLKRLIKPRRARARRPADDQKQAVVSLREFYARRHIDDMLQYDDARRYITMMQNRAFSAIEDFLLDHNVDTQEFRAQIIVIQNSGIINNSGQMSGIQNQPGAIGSQQQT